MRSAFLWLLSVVVNLGCMGSDSDFARSECEIQASRIVNLGTVDGPGALMNVPFSYTPQLGTLSMIRCLMERGALGSEWGSHGSGLNQCSRRVLT